MQFGLGYWPFIPYQENTLPYLQTHRHRPPCQVSVWFHYMGILGALGSCFQALLLCSDAGPILFSYCHPSKFRSKPEILPESPLFISQWYHIFAGPVIKEWFHSLFQFFASVSYFQFLTLPVVRVLLLLLLRLGRFADKGSKINQQVAHLNLCFGCFAGRTLIICIYFFILLWSQCTGHAFSKNSLLLRCNFMSPLYQSKWW